MYKGKIKIKIMPLLLSTIIMIKIMETIEIIIILIPIWVSAMYVQNVGIMLVIVNIIKIEKIIITEIILMMRTIINNG